MNCVKVDSIGEPTGSRKLASALVQSNGDGVNRYRAEEQQIGQLVVIQVQGRMQTELRIDQSGRKRLERTVARGKQHDQFAGGVHVGEIGLAVGIKVGGDQAIALSGPQCGSRDRHRTLKCSVAVSEKNHGGVRRTGLEGEYVIGLAIAIEIGGGDIAGVAANGESGLLKRDGLAIEACANGEQNGEQQEQLTTRVTRH